MTDSLFVVSVGDLGTDHIVSKPVRITATPDWRLELSYVVGTPPTEFAGELTQTSGGLVVRGKLKATVHHTCSRCLAEWDEEASAEVAQLIVPEAADEAGEGDEYVYRGPEVDLEPILRDDLLLSLPLLPTCPAGCERLVEAHGSDLNTVTPDESGESVSPFAVLKDLLDHEQ